MFGKLSSTLFLLIVISAASAETMTADELVGVWMYSAYAQKDDPDKLVSVGVKMDFHANGKITNTLASGKQTEATYSLDGDAITYSDKRGEQVWKIQSFVKGEKLVVDHSGTLMFLEKT